MSSCKNVTFLNRFFLSSYFTNMLCPSTFTRTKRSIYAMPFNITFYIALLALSSLDINIACNSSLCELQVMVVGNQTYSRGKLIGYQVHR